MGYLVVLMLLTFFLVGIGLLKAGIQDCMRRWSARERVLTIMGTIVAVKREYRRPHSPRSGSRHKPGSNYANFPVIRFRTPYGQDVEFRSPSGDMGTPSQYRVGQRIEVLYDPDGEVPPVINSWFGVWFGPVGMTLASLLFIGVSITCSILFRERILATTVLGSLLRMF